MLPVWMQVLSADINWPVFSRSSFWAVWQPTLASYYGHRHAGASRRPGRRERLSFSQSRVLAWPCGPRTLVELFGTRNSEPIPRTKPSRARLASHACAMTKDVRVSSYFRGPLGPVPGPPVDGNLSTSGTPRRATLQQASMERVPGTRRIRRRVVRKSIERTCGQASI